MSESKPKSENNNSDEHSQLGSKSPLTIHSRGSSAPSKGHQPSHFKHGAIH